MSTLAVVAGAGCVGSADAKTAGTVRESAVVHQLRGQARPLADGRTLARAVDTATIVGVGEASHSAHEAFETKRALFQRLARRGFSTFALEVSWSTGLALDRWVVSGRGDLDRIMAHEFQGQYLFWNTDEYAQTFRWMREYNRHRHGRAPVRVVGVDLGYPGPELFDAVTTYAARVDPAQAARLRTLLDPVRPDSTVEPGQWMAEQLGRPLAERAAAADRSRIALDIVRALPEVDPVVVQDARAIVQSLTGYAFDDGHFPQRMQYRDQTMADNLLWWSVRHRGGVLFSSSNTHVGYRSDDPTQFPLTVGQVLHRALGRRYVAIGSTFGQGRINALPDPVSTQPRRYTIPGAPAGYTEHLLARVRSGDFVIDLRCLPQLSRRWLMQPRPTRSYGLYWSDTAPLVAPATTYDVLVHLAVVTPGRQR